MQEKIDILGGGSGKEPACQCWRLKGSIPGLGRLLREGNANPPQHYRLENPMGRGACWAAVHGVARVGAHYHHAYNYTNIYIPIYLAL